MINFDLNRNDSEALLRHAEEFMPRSKDPREGPLTRRIA